MFFGKKKEEKREYYFDYAAKTPSDKSVIDTMAHYQSVFWANPSSLHSLGQQAGNELRLARQTIAQFLSAQPREIIFTSGGTESDIIAIHGVIRAAKKRGVKKPHVVIGAIEHAAVLETLMQMRRDGLVALDLLPTDSSGVYDISELKNLVSEQTVLVSCMTTNNEIGIIQDISLVAKEVRRLKKNMYGDRHSVYPLVHTDASQSVLLHPLDTRKLGVDLLSFGGSKLYGPTGIGVLYVKTGTPIESPWYPDGQEFGLRPGTEPLFLIAGLAKAIQIVKEHQESYQKHFQEIKDYTLASLSDLSKDQMLSSLGFEMKVYGEGPLYSNHLLYVLVKGLESDQMVIELDAREVYVSAKSACKTFDPQTSHVLKSLGYTDNSWGGVRFSFGKDTTKKDVDYAMRAFREVLVKLLHTKKEFNL